MIIDYDSKYDEQVKRLLIELQEYIVSIDKEKYNILDEKYGDNYLEDTKKEIEKYEGKMYLLEENDSIIGLVVGLINNEETAEYDFKAPKRGRISELIVSKNYRSKGYGKKLLNSMENYLKSVGCIDILIGVFAYNESAIKFYDNNGYHTRMIEVTKNVQ